MYGISYYLESMKLFECRTHSKGYFFAQKQMSSMNELINN